MRQIVPVSQSDFILTPQWAFVATRNRFIMVSNLTHFTTTSAPLLSSTLSLSHTHTHTHTHTRTVRIHSMSNTYTRTHTRCVFTLCKKHTRTHTHHNTDKQHQI